MQTRIRNALQINPGELAVVALIAALFFFWEAAREIGGQTATALFISRAGSDKLPYLYIALGFTNMVVATLYSAGLSRVRPRVYYSFVAATLSALIIAQYYLIPRLSAIPAIPETLIQVALIYPILWLTINVGGTILSTMGWSTAGQVLDTRQARRLFSLFASAGILGAALAAGLVRLLSRVYADHIARLLFWQVALVFVGLFAFLWLMRRRSSAGELDTAPEAPQSRRSGAETVFRSSLLRLVAVSLVLFSIMFLTLDLLFNEIVNSAFSEEAGKLDFLAGTSAVIQVSTLIVSIFFTGRLIKRFGVVNANFFLIAAYLIGFGVLLLDASLKNVAFARIIQFVTLGGIVQSSNYIFFNVIPPERRGQAITFTFGIVGQIGVILSGFLLLAGASIPSRFVLPLLGIGLVFVTGWVTLKMREGYRHALVDALRLGRLEVFNPESSGRTAHQIRTDSSSLQFLINSLRDEKPIARKLAAEMIGEIGATSGITGLVQCMADSNASVRAAALESLNILGYKYARKWALEQLHDPFPEVVTTAIDILSSDNEPLDSSSESYLLGKINDNAPEVRMGAIRYLALLGDTSFCQSAFRGILKTTDPFERARALHTLADVVSIFKSRGIDPSTLISRNTLKDLLRDSSPVVRREACLATGALGLPGLVPELMRRFEDTSASVRYAAAMAARELGPAAEKRALKLLATSTENGVLECSLLALRPDKKRHLDAMMAFAQSEISRLQTWRQREASLHYPGRAARLLGEIIRSEITQSEIRLIRVLQVLEPEDAIGWESIIENLKRGEQAHRSAILEALDTLGDTPVARDLILPALEEGAANRGYQPDETHLHPAAALQGLMNSGELWTRALAIAVAAELEIVSLVRPIARFSRKRDPIVKEAARSALRRLKKGTKMTKKSLQTLSSVERIILLREVPLFSSLEIHDLKYLAEIATERVFQEGDYMVRQSDPGDELFIIAEGEVTIRIDTGGKKSEKVSSGKEGDFFGEMAVLDSAPRSASIQCTTPVRALTLEGSAFRLILRDRPEVSLTVLKGLSQRIRHANALLSPQKGKSSTAA